MHSTHLHDLTAASAHHTSEGLVTYYRCACGAWEVRTTAGLDAAIAATRPGGD
ncbi:hypothetical protein [Nonomuraea typhae]|uniref:hypothetical protein n=1 Tax=Nonomuraea typhae TaxID=2603600 RepID=UPI0015E1C056|nr:hypothetical protein [Nonomuraea typhae]